MAPLASALPPVPEAVAAASRALRHYSGAHAFEFCGAFAVPEAPILVRLATSLGISTDYLLGLCDDPRWLNYKEQDLMHRSVDLIEPGDRPLVQGILRVFLKKSL